MKALTVASFLFALGALAFSGVALGTRAGRAAGAASDAARAVGPDGARDLEQEVVALRDQRAALLDRIDALEMRLTQLEARPAAVAPAREAVALEDTGAQLTALKDLVAALEKTEVASSPAFEALVFDAIETKEELDRQARDERRRQQEEDRLAARLLELEQELGLSPQQSKEMGAVLANESARRDELRDQMRSGDAIDRDSMFESFRALREETQTSIAGILAPDQLTRYEELQAERRGPWGGGGFGGFGGGRRDRGSEQTD